MPWSSGRTTDEVQKLIDALPLTFQWYTGNTQPPCPTQSVIWWEDLDNEVGKIIMRRGAKTYVFTAYESSQEDPTTIHPGDHAHRHATGGSSLTDVGDDPLGPYSFTWVNEHSYSPSTGSYVPITINAGSAQTADLLRIKRSDGTRIFTVDSDSAVGINEDDPQAYLAVQSRGFSPAVLSPTIWYKPETLTGTNGAPITSWTDSSAGGTHTAVPGSRPAVDGGGGLELVAPSLKTSAACQCNGYNTLEFNVAFNGLWITSQVDIAVGQGFTVFAVYTAYNSTVKAPLGANMFDSVGTQTYLDFPTVGGTNEHRMTVKDSNTPDTEALCAGTELTSAGSDSCSGNTHSGWHVHTLRRSTGGSYRYRRDGGADVSGDNSINRLFRFAAIGIHTASGGGEGGRFTGRLVEYLLFNSELSDGNVANVESYLLAKFGLGGSGGTALPLQYWQDSIGSVKAQVSEEFYLGLNADPAVRLHVVDTNEQFRLGYDTSPYASFTVNSSGDLTLDLSASSRSFIFQDLGRFNAAIYLPTTAARFGEISTPAHIANVGSLYGKDFSGRTELCWLDSDGASTGAEARITKSGRLNAVVAVSGDSGSPTSGQDITIAGGAGLTSSGSGDTITVAVGAGTGITVNTNDVALTVPVVLANGGTGLTAYTAGDLAYFASGTAFTKLAIGSSGQYLRSTGTAPSWSDLVIPAMADPASTAANAGKIWVTVPADNQEQLLKIMLKKATGLASSDAAYAPVILAGGGP